MIKLYKRLTHHCKTINQINRVHIALENWMTPIQWQTLQEEIFVDPDYSFLKANFEPESLDDFSLTQRKWFATMKRNFQLGLSKEAQSFRRLRLRRYLALYGIPSLPKADKTLIVCFTGMSQRMMTPLASFLQNIDAKENDVALVTYPKDKGFRNGLEGTAKSFEEMIDKIKDLFASQGYKRVVAIGVSGGGIPAILCAIRAGWQSALAFGAGSPSDKRWLDALGFDLSILFKKYCKKAFNSIPLYLVYGADSKIDYEAAKSIQKLLPANLIKVGSKSEKVGHVVLNPLLMSGQLASFLKKTVLNFNDSHLLKDDNPMPSTIKGAPLDHKNNQPMLSLPLIEGPRVVCVGFNKTGTTTLGRCFDILGIGPVGEPRSPYMNYIELSKPIFDGNDYKPALFAAKYFRAFQDRPWNVGNMYQYLDIQYPESRFILTEREPESWWGSVNKWLTQSHENDKDRLQRYLRHLNVDRFDKELFISRYIAHNAAIRDYFSNRDNLLIMNLAQGEGWEKLCSFLDLPVPDKPFPHANKQRDC